MNAFENIHCHTHLSNAYIGFPDSPTDLGDYAKVYKERGMACLIASEHGFRGDCWAQYDVGQKYGLKAIPAVEAYFVPNNDPELKDDRNFHLLLLARNNEGFEEMNLALSEANVHGFYKHGRLDFALLEQLNPKNFLCTTACIGGILRDEAGEEMALRLYNIFRENFYLEIQPHLEAEQIEHNKRVLELHKKYRWPLILGTDSHYVNREDKILREELQLSKKIQMDDGAWDLFLPTADEAFDMLWKQGIFRKSEIEAAMEATLQVREWEGFSYDSERKFPISRPNMTPEQRAFAYQKAVCDGYLAQFGQPTDAEKKELRDEMNMVLKTGSYDYFLGLYDLMNEARKNGGILTKTSRGSAASFATSAALGFTSLNRLHEPVKLYPKRFVSEAKLAKAMPDIDTNLSNPEVFEEAGRTVFGEHGCYPMIALGKQKTLSAFKMLARARNLDFEISNNISKQISSYELDRKHKLENNQDDPDYDVDDDIDITDYVNKEYVQYIEDSKKYQGIISSISPHPCARLVYHEDIRRKVGLISLKPKAGKTERTICACIEGATADAAGYCKDDLLMVDVVSVINDTFKMIGRETPSVDELKAWVEANPQVWDLFARGFTLGMNQTERASTTEKVKRFKPRNIVELTTFVAAIRPGGKSLIDDLISRRPHNYGIPAMDKLLKLTGASGVTGESSFLFFDEDILTLAEAAGIDPGDAVTLIKSIKKKKHDKVAAYEAQFVPGFIKFLEEKEGTEHELAEKTAHDVWTVIMNSASYLFCRAHALAMNYDCLYGAMLKTIAPYEFYTVLLKLYTKKGQTEKVALCIEEMRKNQGIGFKAGKFGQDNTDWFIDKEGHTISQALSSVKFISPKAAEDLKEVGQYDYPDFTHVLRTLQMDTCLNTRMIDVLIRLDYFDKFGKSGKLLKIFEEFFNGKNKVTKTVKSAGDRIAAISEMESRMTDEEISIKEKLDAEVNYIGLPISSNPAANGLYYIQELDDKYAIKMRLYNISRGSTSPVIRLTKQEAARLKPAVGDVIRVNGSCLKQKPKYTYKDGTRRDTGETEWWLDDYRKVK